MASVTMTPAFFGGSTAASKAPTTSRRGFFPVRASKVSEGAKPAMNTAEESRNGRRELLLGVSAAVVAAAWSVDMIASAEEPKPGTPEAKKKYAPICVTMPTAKICRK